MGTCSRCGKCHSYCPVYRVYKDERYSPRGKYHLLAPGCATDIEEGFLDDLAWACLQCGACHADCPSGADVDARVRSFRETWGAPRYLKEALGLLRDSGGHGRAIWRLLKGLPFGMGLTSRLLRLTPWGTPRLPGSTFLDELKGTSCLQARGDISLFIGCVQNYVCPNIPRKALELSSAHHIFVPPEQTCCGLPAWSSGFMDTAREFALKNLEALLKDNTKCILTLCSSCAYAIRVVWPELFEPGTRPWHLATQAASILWDMDDYISSIDSGVRQDFESPVLHLPCHARHLGRTAHDVEGEYLGLRLKGVIRECCGHGGSFSYNYPGTSKEIFNETLSRAKARWGEFDLVLTTCSGCLLQWKMGLSGSKPKAGGPSGHVTVLHPIELL